MSLENFLRKAEQVLALARKTADPELRRELEEIARACLAGIGRIEGELELTVDLWGMLHTIRVHRKKPENVWIAVGQYMGKRLEVKANSHSAAVTRWIRAAH